MRSEAWFSRVVYPCIQWYFQWLGPVRRADRSIHFPAHTHDSCAWFFCVFDTLCSIFIDFERHELWGQRIVSIGCSWRGFYRYNHGNNTHKLYIIKLGHGALVMAIYTLSEWNCIPSGVWNSHLDRTRCLGRPQRPGPVLFCDMISSYGRLFESFVEHLWLVGGLKHGFYFSIYIYIYWECHHPNWRIYIYIYVNVIIPTDELHHFSEG